MMSPRFYRQPVATTSAGTEIVADVVCFAALDTHLKQAGFRWQGYNALRAKTTWTT
jgi:hypothetical protein